MQKVDDRHQLSLPLFYPDYKPGSLKSRSSKDVQFFEGSPRSSRSQSTQRSNLKSTREQWAPNPSRPEENSLKSCLRKSNEKHAMNKDNFKDADNDTKGGYFKETNNNRKSGDFKDADSGRGITAVENRSRFPKKTWRSTKVEHKDSVDESKKNSENVKMKGFSYPRFRYPLRFHYGSAVQSRSGIISAIPAGFRTSSFYSSLPRRQRQISPGNLSTEKKRSGKDGRRKHETKPAEEKIEVVNDRNSRTSSPDRELNGVYLMVHEPETAQLDDDSKAEQKRKSVTTHEDNSRTTQNKPEDDDDDEVLEIQEIEADGSVGRSSISSQSDRSEVDDTKAKQKQKQKSKTTHEGEHTRTTHKQPDDDDDDEEALEVEDYVASGSNGGSSKSSHRNRSDESIKEAGSSSDDERLKNEKGSSDDADLSRSSRKKEKQKKQKKKKSGHKDKTETPYAADFDEDNS